MSFFASLLTFVLVINSLLLIFLVLIQLPKKDAGAGMAFGAGAADALFGAGSGNALTKITKYSAGVLIGLCLLINLMGGKPADDTSTAAYMKQVDQQAQQRQAQPAKAPAPGMSAPPVTTPAEIPAPAAASTNGK
jgi:preprotein translocase subunit SecG